MLKTSVKISAVTNLTDARYFAAREVEWLGFNLNQNDEQYLAPNVVLAIKEWVDGVKIVGEFGFQSAADILETANTLGLDAIHLGHHFPLAEVLELDELPIFKEVVIDQETDLDAVEGELAAFAQYVQAFVLDFAKNGYSWKDLADMGWTNGLKDICAKYPVFLAINWSAESVEIALKNLSLRGIVAQGGEEEKVGIKSFEELDEIFDVLEIEE